MPKPKVVPQKRIHFLFPQIVSQTTPPVVELPRFSNSTSSSGVISISPQSSRSNNPLAAAENSSVCAASSVYPDASNDCLDSCSVAASTRLITFLPDGAFAFQRYFGIPYNRINISSD